MRQVSRFACGLLFLLLPLPALSQSTRFEVSAFFEPGGSYSESEGFDYDNGLGVGLGLRVSPAWTVDARALFHDARYAEDVTYQLGLRYAFGREEARGLPYVVGGLHHREDQVRYPVECVMAPCPDHEEETQVTGAFAGGGFDYQARPWFSIRIDGRLAAYESDATGHFEHEVDLTLGVAFKF